MRSVPFVENPKDHCLPACIGMVLAYFLPDKKMNLQQLDNFCGYIKNKGTWPTLSMINLAKLGFKLKWIEDFDHQAFVDNPVQYLSSILDKDALEYQLAHSDLKLEAERMREYIALGLPLEQRQGTKTDIQHLLDEGWLVRLEVNARVLAKRPGYEGHSILVIDYDESWVTIHNPDGDNGNKPNQQVDWDTLNQAWKEFGDSYSLYAFKRD